MTARRERKKSKKTSSTCSFSDDKIEAMKQKARELSKMIGQNSKTVINQQITPPENNLCTNSEHCFDVDIICKNDTDTSKNNDKSVTFANNDSSSIPSCSKSPSSNHAFKRSNSKYLNIKHKKPKIPYLVKCDIYQEEHVDNLTSKKQDDYVLEKLFNKSGRFHSIIIL